MKVNGDTTCSMDKEKKCGLMDQYMKENMHRERSMDMEFTAGMMDQCTMVNGVRIKLRDKVHIHGQMVESSKENGQIIIWKEWVSIHGLTEEGMKVNIKMTKNMDTGYMSGQMVDITKVGGIKANSTASACIKFLVRILNTVFGKKAKGLNGSTLRQPN